MHHVSGYESSLHRYYGMHAAECVMEGWAICSTTSMQQDSQSVVGTVYMYYIVRIMYMYIMSGSRTIILW